MLGTMGKELSANRVREIALKALRKLMHPRNYRTYRDYAEPQRRLYSHSKAIDYNWIYRKLIHLLSMKLTDAGILTFMNMEGLKWSMSDLYEHIDRVNDMADQAAEEYEAGIDYYLIRDHINRRFDIRIDSYFVEYLLHEYMNIAKKEESKTK